MPTATASFTLPPSASSPTLPLTFGLEFEHILAFHSSLLLPHLPAGTAIIKHLTPSTRLALRQTTSQYLLTRPRYNGWGLTSATDYPSPFGRDWHNKCLEEHGCRGYADEALNIERDILTRQCDGTEVVVHDGKGKMRDFSRWHLTTDTSLVGATPSQLGDIIGAGRAETEEWDSAPLELVSRPLSLDDEETSFAEIENILAMLKPGRDDDDADSNTGYYKTFTDAWCGLHVHIGLPPENNNDKCDEFLSLGMLQHLAYILILYEPALSTLHPRSRRPDAQVDLGSNRDMFYPEPDYGEVDWDAVSLPRDDRDSGYASDSDRDDGDGVVIDFPTEGKYDAVSQQAEEDLEFELQVQRRARELVFKPDQTVGGLCGLMSSGGQKGRLVNWTYLAGRGEGVGKRTLEFRQHEGSLEAGEVRRWVLFLRALVRWAEGVGKAAEGRREGDEGMEAWLEEVCGRGVLGIQELVERMELGEEGREWVRARVEMWKD